MEQIRTEFKQKGWLFKQLRRSGDVALYSKELSGHVSFEVIIVQKRKAHTFPNGHHTPEHEAMPSSESWGTHGWTYTNFESAKAKFNTLTP